MAKRKGFNFYESYYDVYNELSNSEKVMFMDALLHRQFFGIEPKNLKGMSKFAYISQKHSIDRQIKGFEDKTGVKLTPATGGYESPTEEVQEKEEVEVQEKHTIQYSDVLKIFNSVCVNLPKVQKISDKRKKLIDARAKEYDLETIGDVFKKVSKSDFLNGRNGNEWNATFDWIFNPTNFLKILEDNYINKTPVKQKSRDAAVILQERHGY